MLKRFFMVCGVAGLAVLEAAALAILPWPMPMLRFSLIAVTNLVTSFRIGLAWSAAFAAGLVLDLLMPWPPGCGTLGMLAVVAVLTPLTTRVLTHISLPSLVGINVIAFAVFNLTATAVRSASDLLESGHPHFWPAGGFWLFGLALLTQTALAALWQVVARKVHRSLVSSFLVLR